MFAVVLGCVLCSLSTAAYLSERKRARTGTLLSGSRCQEAEASNARRQILRTGQAQGIRGQVPQGLTTWGDCDNLKVIGRQTGQLIQKSKDEESTFREALQRRSRRRKAMCRCRRLRGIGPKRMEDGFGAAHRTAGTPGARLRQVPPVTAAGYERGRKLFLMYLLRPCL